MDDDSSQVALLAQFAVAPDAGISDDVRQTCLVHLADGIACLLSGRAQPIGAIVSDLVESYGSVSEATVVGGGFRAAADLAALANGCMMHALDWDDFTNTNMHPTSIVLPSVLAVGESDQASGEQVFDSFIVGAEIAARLGRALNPAVFLRGFHPSGGLGAIAATGALAHLQGLTREQTAHAFALALAGAGGLLANKGTMAKPFQVGNAGRAAIVAVRLAQAGVTATRDVLSERHGIADTMLAGLDSGHDLAALTRDLGTRWEIQRDWMLKPYPVGGGRLTLIESCIKLATENDLDITQIEAVHVTASPFILHIDHSHPASATDGRFSHAYCAAISLIDRAAGIIQFEDERFMDPVVQDLARRIELTPDNSLSMKPADGDGFPTTVTVTTRDGQRFEEHVARAKGEADRAATLEDAREKFMVCAPQVMDAAGASDAWDFVITLPRQPSLRPLMENIGEMRASSQAGALGRNQG